MSLDAIIISSAGFSSLSESSSMKLTLDGKTATLQLINTLMEGTDLSSANNNLQALNWHYVPKLNGIAIFSYLSKKGFSCGLIDNLEDEIERFIQLLKSKPSYIILSTSFIYKKSMLVEAVNQIRRFAPNINIVAGGPFVYSSYLLMQQKNDPTYDTSSAEKDFLFLSDDRKAKVDYYIISLQGLDTLIDLMTEKPKNEISGLGFYTEKGLQITPPSPSEIYQRLTIDWEKLPNHLFLNRVMPVQASNGCPFKCRFCNFVKDKRATFVRPIDDIIDDLKQLQQLGVKYVRFVDDNFRHGQNDIEQVCRRIIEEKINIQWLTFMRASSLSKVNMKLLRKAGCKEVQLGLESAHPSILREMNKQSDPQTYYKVVKSLLLNGIDVSATFIIGFPGETEETAQTTIDFIKSIDFTEHEGNFVWWIFPFMLIPLCPVYDPKERIKYGLEGYWHNWRHDTMNYQEAQKIIKKAFFEIENTSQGYSADNLDMMQNLSPLKRKQFMLTRHKLSKVVQSKKLTDSQIVEVFKNIFQSK